VDLLYIETVTGSNIDWQAVSKPAKQQGQAGKQKSPT
jgi:hypothetical protein